MVDNTLCSITFHNILLNLVHSKKALIVNVYVICLRKCLFIYMYMSFSICGISKSLFTTTLLQHIYTGIYYKHYEFEKAL